MAKVLAMGIIRANHVSDRRYAIGEVILKDPNGKVIWKVDEEGKEKKEGGE
jgi:hypothetical protein